MPNVFPGSHPYRMLIAVIALTFIEICPETSMFAEHLGQIEVNLFLIPFLSITSLVDLSFLEA